MVDLMDEIHDGFFMRIPTFSDNFDWDELYAWLHETYDIGNGRYQIIQCASRSYHLILFRDQEDLMACKMAFKLMWS